MLSVSIPLLVAVITIISVSFSTGLAVGFFTWKFVPRNECKEQMEKVWNRVDAIQDSITGGPYTFKVELNPKEKK